MRRFPITALITGNLASRLTLMALRQNSQTVYGPGALTHRNPHMELTDACSETSERRKEFIDSPTNPCQCFCVVDAPEIHHAAGPVVVSEFLTAIQASDVASSATDRPASGKVGWDGIAQCYRRTLMPMKADKNKTKQCTQKERYA